MTKKKILFISDDPRSMTGVGTQAKLLIEGLLNTGKYSFFCLGGAMRHRDYQTVRVEEKKYGSDWLIKPIDGHGNKELLLKLLESEKPDAVMIFTDPRFFVWIWEMEDEVRSKCPLLYWHVWDNDPLPHFNLKYYDSTDYIAALSLKTYGILQGIGYDKEKFSYIPHAINPKEYFPLPEKERLLAKKELLGQHWNKKFVVFWNNRNARRKLPGTMVDAFSRFAKIVGKENVTLAIHTQVFDREGQNLVEVAKKFGVDDCLVVSQNHVPYTIINKFYNACDVTISVSSNEGFGLGTLESLMAGTPVIVNMTGGLQFQIGDWWKGLTDFSDQSTMTLTAKNSFVGSNWYGAPVFPAARECVGSQEIPFIYDDHPNVDDISKALLKMYVASQQPEYSDLRKSGSEWARNEFSIEKMISSWDKILENQTNSFKKGTRQLRIVDV